MSEALPSASVRKELDPIVDVGDMCLDDLDPLSVKPESDDFEQKLCSIARVNVQFLVNELWKLPTERVNDVIVATLPSVTSKLPREKHIPKPKPMTKWQQYAQLKGIQKRKASRKIWDAEAKEWKYRWGYKRANDDTNVPMVEIPHNADPYQDYFEKLAEKKSERKSKNELQRLRNIKRASKTPNANAGTAVTPDQLAHQALQARKATASLGVHTEKLAKEKPPKNKGIKHKFEPNEGRSSLKKEKDQQLEILARLSKKKPELNVEKALSHKSSLNSKASNKGPSAPKRLSSNKGKLQKAKKNAKRGKMNKRS